MNSIFKYKPNLFQKVWWPVRRFFRELPWNIKQIKFFYQRGKRGWADCDWWEMQYYLIKSILPMLKELRKYMHGYPGYGEASTPEEWDRILDDLILGFEAGKRVSEDKYVDEFQPGWYERGEKLTSETLQKSGEQLEKDETIFHARMKLFDKWFFNLWD